MNAALSDEGHQCEASTNSTQIQSHNVKYVLLGFGPKRNKYRVHEGPFEPKVGKQEPPAAADADSSIPRAKCQRPAPN